MLNECKLALRVTATAYDAEIAALIMAAAADLGIAGVLNNGIKLTVNANGTVTDESTNRDALLQRAIITYVRLHFGSPDDYDRLKAAYDEQKAQLMTATGHTDFGSNEGGESTW